MFRKFGCSGPIFAMVLIVWSKKYLWVGSKGRGVKGGSASYLQRVKSKLGLGQGPSLVHVGLATLILLHLGPRHLVFNNKKYMIILSINCLILSVRGKSYQPFDSHREEIRGKVKWRLKGRNQ